MRQQGFTAVEMAVTVAIIGVAAATAGAAYSRLIDSGQQRLTAAATAATLTEAVIAFASASHRLPCPDTVGNGYEAPGAACPAGVQTGWFPYQAVGLPLPPPASRARYGVHRSAGADLTVAQELSGDAAGTPAFADRADFIRALGAASIAAGAVPAVHPFVTGDLATQGAENCAANLRGNPAFVIALPGTDRDGDSNGFDGIHQNLAAGSLCFAAPTRTTDAGFDDATAAVGFFALMARLNTFNN